MFKKSTHFTQFKKAVLILALVAFVFEPLTLAMPTKAWAYGEYAVEGTGGVVYKAYAKPNSKAAAFGYNTTASNTSAVALGYGS